MDIIVNDITVTVSGKTIFSNVSFEIKSGQLVAITGPSGCGKTTLLNCLGLTQSIDHGSIFIDNKNTKNWPDKEKTNFWRDYASFIYQDYGIIEEESVAYNVTLNKHKTKSDQVKSILNMVGLSGRDYDLAVVLSGGEKQRVGIARAIYKNASIIYADEPTASLDEENRELVITLLRQCSKNGNIVILATHDENLVHECDKIINLTNFRV